MIEINNLSFHHKKQKTLFNNLTYKQTSGSITGLLGKNGAGKSTLLKLSAGLLHPKQGSIIINGYTPSNRNPDFLADIFLVSDEPYLPSLTVASYLAIYAPLYKNFDLEKMSKILKEFELEAHQKLDGISHGQQKKFIIAFALSTNCKLLLLDEPTNGLDIPSKRIFRKVLISSVEEDQLVVISTHQVKDIETIIDKIVIIEEGTIVFEKETQLVTEKLQFQKLESISENSNIIYSEKCPGGYNAILPANNDEETEIDIELLFNAICNKTEIKL